MPAWICRTCGVQYPDTAAPAGGLPDLPGRAAVRRAGGASSGRPWTSCKRPREQLREEEPDLLGDGSTRRRHRPAGAAGAHAGGNVLWDCVPCSTTPRRDDPPSSAASPRSACRTRTSTGSTSIADAFDAPCTSPRGPAVGPAAITAGGALRRRGRPVPGLTIARIGGHFDGAAVLHWPAGSEGRGALLTGDTMTVVQDRAWVTSCGATPT